MVRLRRLMGAAATLVVLVAIMFPSMALAHEKRTVGKYTFVVGFMGEPAIQGQPNGLDLTITDANGAPVMGAEKTLKVGIAFGGSATKDLPLRARFGLNGKYTADVIPTKPGTYSFVFTGTLNGDPVNETFESGPGRFNDVDSPASLQFPPVTDSTTSATVAPASDAAMQRATLLGGAGIAVGLIGIILGAVAISMRGRTSDSTVSDVESHSGVSA